MSENEFLEGMVELVQDKTVVYESMIRNINGLGSVLKKKFALLQVAYTMFMAALILGVTSFIGVFVWIQQTAPQKFIACQGLGRMMISSTGWIEAGSRISAGAGTLSHCFTISSYMLRRSSMVASGARTCS